MIYEKTISKENLINQFTEELKREDNEEKKTELLISYIEKLQLETAKHSPNGHYLEMYGIRSIEQEFIYEFHLDEDYNHIENLPDEDFIKNLEECLDCIESYDLDGVPNASSLTAEIIAKFLK